MAQKRNNQGRPKRPVNKQQKKGVKKVSEPVSSPSPAPQNKSDFEVRSWMIFAIVFIIAAATFISYQPALKNKLTNWDDNAYVVGNPANGPFDATRLNNIFFGRNFYHMGNYHPFALLSLGIDFHLNKNENIVQYGKRLRYEFDEEFSAHDPFIYHLHNLILHVLNTLLVFWFVFILLFKERNMKRLIIAAVAGLFYGVSTIHVESVAWVSERKDVLHMFYFMFSLVAYVYYCKKENFAILAVSLLLFFFSLLAKAQAVSLTITIVAVDLYLRRDWKSLKVIFEKIPFFALSVLFGVLAIKAQNYGEAIHDIDEYPFYQRIMFAAYGFMQYLFKLAVPYDLAAIYPYPHLEEGKLAKGFFPYPLWLNLVMISGVIFLFIKGLKKAPLAVFGLAFFTINIFLQLQLIPVGSAIMADRYAYLPSAGISLMLGYGVYLLFENKELPVKIVIIGVFALYSVFLGMKTWKQSEVWKDSISLWTNTVDIAPTAVVAWNNMGSAYDKINEKEEAIRCFDNAVEYKPDYAHALYNRGTAKKDLNRFEEAITDFNAAIGFDPSFSEAYHNRGISKENVGLVDEAIDDYNRAIEFKPDDANVYSSRGVAKGKSGDLQAAIADFNKSIELKENNPEAFSNRGLANDKLGKLDESIADYNHALELNPEFATAYSNRGLVYRKLKKYDEAMSDFSKAIELKPDFAEPYFTRGTLHFDLGDRQSACNDFVTSYQKGNPKALYYVQKFCPEIKIQTK